ncbi:MAG TPA: GNAT family N-acetyltransferase [Pyrinomonadaceae bacterium]|jgi:predicted GNAT superfamily acetyltransferase
MMTHTKAPAAIIIRDIELVQEMRAVERLQKEVWGCDELEVLPLTFMRASREVGAILVGAFAEDELVGFAYGFVGLEDGRLVVHSDMLAVKPEYRGCGLGIRLKLAQRERAIALGIESMTWTFDPLQSRNAHLNFARLGVVSHRYEIDFYGAQTSSFLHRNIGTDRLWVRWPLLSERVRQRLAAQQSPAASLVQLERLPRLVRLQTDGTPLRIELHKAPAQSDALIEIPCDISLLQEERAELARSWRLATRGAFKEALAAGYAVAEFYRLSRQGQSLGAYLLSLDKNI